MYIPIFEGINALIVVNTDLDNTLIYSYKHDIGTDKINVELYQGREVSFVTENTGRLLKKLCEKALLVPTSTRTIEQYNRIHLGIEPVKYALVCNGGVLLMDGKKDEDWYKESLDIVANSRTEIETAYRLLEKEENRKFELRNIEELFLFTKCEQPEKVAAKLRSRLDTTRVEVFTNGEKIYVVPEGLNKGRAIKRFKEYIGADYVIAAGDSRFDLSMADVADLFLAPNGFIKEYDILETNRKKILEAPEKKYFSDFILEECIKMVD